MKLRIKMAGLVVYAVIATAAYAMAPHAVVDHAASAGAELGPIACWLGQLIG